MSRQHADVRQSRRSLTPLGRTADKIAGAIRGGLDRLTGTTYQPVPYEDLNSHARTQREDQAYTRYGADAPPRNAYERALYHHAAYETRYDYMTDTEFEQAEDERIQRIIWEDGGRDDMHPATEISSAQASENEPEREAGA